ncbi:MAG: hypothetical protein ACRDNX_14100, partial [Gaiellaceae bacterium]
GSLRDAGGSLAASAPVVHAPMVASIGMADPLLRDLRIRSLKPLARLPLGAAKPVLKISV